MPIKTTHSTKPSLAKIRAVLERYQRSANELLAVTSALEANGDFESNLTTQFDLICAARDRAAAREVVS